MPEPTESSDPTPKLSPEEAQALIKAIEEVEREEAAAQTKQASSESAQRRSA